MKAISLSLLALLVTTAGAAPAAAAAGRGRAAALSHPPPKNILVNDPTGDRFPNITQLGPTVAVFGSRVVVGWCDSGSSSGKIAGVGFGLGYGFSTDGGETFTDGGALRGGGLDGSSWGADPSLAVDRAGNFYFGRFALISTSPARGTSAGATVYKSTDGGATFAQAVPPFGAGAGTADRVFLTVDKSGGPRDGTVYLTWAQSVAGGVITIQVSQSRNGGVTFSPPVQVSPSTGVHQFPTPAVGPEGELYLAWYELNLNRVYLRKSLDGGATFGPTITVMDVNQIGSIAICSTTARSGLNGDIRSINMPIVAVDSSRSASRGNVYIAIASAPVPGGPDTADAYLLRSTDGGSTWDAPHRLNDDTTRNDQWLPFVAVAPDGTVGAMWYDRRLDPDNLLLDIFMTVSTDGGQTFAPNFRITDVSSPVPRLKPIFDPLAASDCFMGDNNFMVADEKNFYLVWTDSRLVASGVPDPIIFFAKVPVGPNLPIIATQPASQTIANGSSVAFRVEASDASTYQWQLNGATLAGATGATLVINRATAADAGNYSCVISNSSGRVTSAVAALALSASTDTGRLINLSVLTDVSAANPLFTVGTVVGGDNTSGTLPLLFRAAGPSLAPLGVSGALADPKLDLFLGQTLLATNDDWAGDAALAAAFTAVGAFSYSSASSKDAAIYRPSTGSGSYTIQASGHGTAGAVLAEVYDAVPPGARTPATPRLVNVSVLKSIPEGTTLTVGFAVGGATARTVLLRAVGPTLGVAPIGVSGAMPDPQLKLFNSAQTVIATNDDWGGDSPLASTAGRVGAFALSNASSKDAVLLLTLAPGSYTAQVSATAGTAGGAAIVEVYEVP